MERVKAVQMSRLPTALTEIVISSTVVRDRCGMQCFPHEEHTKAFCFSQVHGLDPNTWKTVEIVHIDIADRSQVEPAVSTP
jgi:hypothetical protein